MTENFPNLKKETCIQVQETQSITNKMNPNRHTPRHIIIKMAKVKQKASKGNKRKPKNYIQGKTHKAFSYFSAETL